MKCYLESDYKLITRRIKIGRIALYSLLVLFVAFSILMMAFISRSNKTLMLALLCSISVAMFFAIVIMFFYVKFYKKLRNHFKNVYHEEVEEITSQVTYIEKSVITLNENLKARQIEIMKDDSPFVVYILAYYENEIIEGKTYRFKLSGNYLLEAVLDED